jgi:precorrin-2/cobalt-factor-2 C20-methyltransferase
MLIGVGLGPGDPDLLTLKAVEVLKNSDYVYVPGRMAEELVKPHTTAEILDFPMLTDYDVLNEVWKRNAEVIAEQAIKGDVAFGLIGDPNFFSTFTHLKRVMKKYYPEVKTTTVPGISSITSFAARTGSEVDSSFEVTDGSEKKASIRLKAKSPREIAEKLSREGYTEFVFAEKLFSENESIIHGIGNFPEKGNYFSIVYASKK